ncbi:MAG: M23 family metallopeptidase [Anaerolineae bacterium]|nr:M23 family metallopeptidase [Anaerolineae bacterium]
MQGLPSRGWARLKAIAGLSARITYETIYGHLSALAVLTNATVSRGQIIGTRGNTGNVFGAPQGGHHLHFEVRLNGQPTDPFGGANANWLWRDGAWDAQRRWIGQPAPRYGATLVVDEDNPQQVGDPNDDPYFTKGRGGLGGTTCPPSRLPILVVHDRGGLQRGYAVYLCQRRRERLLG